MVSELSPMSAPLMVLGMHRSGTSLVARLLSELGVFWGPSWLLYKGDQHNPGGYFELRDLVTCNDRLLDGAGGAWDMAPVDLQVLAAPGPESLTEMQRAIQEVSCLARSAGRVWGVKDPRMSFTWRAWIQMLPTTRVVICLRDPLAIAQSLSKRGLSSLRHGLTLSAQYFDSLSEIPADRVHAFVLYDQLANDPERVIHRLIRQLNLNPGEEKLAAALERFDKRLVHNKGRLRQWRQAARYEAVQRSYVRLMDKHRGLWLDSGEVVDGNPIA